MGVRAAPSPVPTSWVGGGCPFRFNPHKINLKNPKQQRPGRSQTADVWFLEARPWEGKAVPLNHMAGHSLSISSVHLHSLSVSSVITEKCSISQDAASHLRTSPVAMWHCAFRMRAGSPELSQASGLHLRALVTPSRGQKTKLILLVSLA